MIKLSAKTRIVHEAQGGKGLLPRSCCGWQRCSFRADELRASGLGCLSGGCWLEGTLRVSVMFLAGGGGGGVSSMQQLALSKCASQGGNRMSQPARWKP